MQRDVVAIGASAGGIEAVSKLLSYLPAELQPLSWSSSIDQLSRRVTCLRFSDGYARFQCASHAKASNSNTAPVC